MDINKCSILTVVPYRILPPRSGGQLSITYLHHYLGLLCPTNVAGTKDNELNTDFSFQLHPVFPVASSRYIPYSHTQKLVSIGKKYDASAIICEHPYMALTAKAVAKRLKIPWYLRSQNIESERFRELGKPWWRILALYEQYAMKQASGTLFITAEDAQWAIENYGLKKETCHVIPYGTILNKPPQPEPTLKRILSKEMNIDPAKKWIYFLGALDYKPNSDAVRDILTHVLPGLTKTGNDFEIIIGGKGLADELQQQIQHTPCIHYAGFIPDLDRFLKACDIMVNPILSGGGIKTKLVEALGYNKLVVSTANGSMGIAQEVCGNNLRVVDDHDWDSFINAIVEISAYSPSIPDAFYKTYYWGNIAEKALSIVSKN